MNCSQVRKKLNEYDLGIVPETSSAAIEAHLRDCEACRRELERYRAVTAALGTLPEVKTPDLWPAVRGQLRPRRRSLSVWQPAWQPALAMAAAVLIAVIALHGTVLPTVVPADTNFDTAAAQASDEQLVAVSWQQPMSDEAALGMSLAMLDTGGDDG